MTSRQMFIDAVIALTGLPYQYGGDGRVGIDCSGVVIAGMQALDHEYPDMTAAGLRDAYKEKIIPASKIRPGCLLFYANAHHVVVCIRDWGSGKFVLLGANGGTPLCLTPDDAYHSTALVSPELCKIVNGVYDGFWHTGFCGAVDPFLGEV